VAAVVLPRASVLGDLAMAVAELAAAALMVVVGRRPGMRGWRVLALALVVPVAWALVAPAGSSVGARTTEYFSWAPTIPAYLLAILASFTFLPRARMRAGRPRVAVELLLFTTACLVGVELLVLGPDGRWSAIDAGLRLTLGTAVVTMSATMAMGLTLAGVVRPGRRPMALGLLTGSMLMSAGQGLGASLAFAAVPGVVDASRFAVVAGMIALAAAALADPGPGTADAERDRPATGTWAQLRQVTPHAAMVVAMLVAIGSTLIGHRPSGVVLAGVACCVVLAAVHRWLTAREEGRMAGRLRRSESYFRSLVRSSGDAVLILDGHLQVTWASAALERVLGPAAAELVGRPLLDAVHPEDAESLGAALPRAGGPGQDDGPADAGLLLLRLRDADGTWRFLEAGISDLRRDTDVGAVVLHCRDMTERLAREQSLQSVAYTDPMTGLPNRAGWLHALERAVAEPAGPPAALLLIELDLGDAREHAGREVATALVAEIGRRLRSTVREEDVVARLGGGAFAVLAGGSPGEADQLAARCLDVVEHPIPTPAGVLEVTGSVGVAPLERGLSVDEVRSRAELAVRAARSKGPGTAARYDDELGAAAARRERLRIDLEGAAIRGELSLAFLPVVSLSDQRVRGLEALLRWRHSDLGQIPPAEFLPIAERAGLIGGLQRWVLREAMAAAVALPEVGQPVRMGVNVSAGYLRGGTVVGDVQAALEATGLQPDRLVLELTDDALAGADERIGLDVATLRLMGVHVALDDFGTGRSALGHLTAVPLDIIKIDVSLVARVDKDPQARALCESIVGMGRALGLEVGAEGVETPAQLAALLGLGCGFAQGFLIARPASFADIASLLRERAGQLWPGLVGSQ
jgi:diguanylate cyclase (GGDEF)-like protein/PAS domain S-box-containing protein